MEGDHLYVISTNFHNIVHITKLTTNKAQRHRLSPHKFPHEALILVEQLENVHFPFVFHFITKVFMNFTHLLFVCFFYS